MSKVRSSSCPVKEVCSRLRRPGGAWLRCRRRLAKGASLDDPSGLFNGTLEGNTWRAIDFHEGDKIDAKALKAPIRDAVALNTSD